MDAFTAEQLLVPLSPEEGALTPLFQVNFDDDMLREIAEADYGWKAEENFAFLQPMLRTGHVAPDDFRLREVLEMTRWHRPSDPKWPRGDEEPKGHWMRLFACSALLRFVAEHPGVIGSDECDTLVHLVSSAIELGPPVAQAAASVLAWRFLAFPGDGESPSAAFLAFSILLLAAHLEPGEDGGPWLTQLAAWVLDEESRGRQALTPWFSHLEHWDQWLIGLSDRHQDAEEWRALALQVLVRPERPHPSDARQSLQLLGELVAGI